MPNKLTQSSWNFLRDNSKLHGVISHRIEGKELKQIGKDLGLNPYLVSWYLKGRKPNLSNYDIIRLCSYLGIEIDLSISLPAS